MFDEETGKQVWKNCNGKCLKTTKKCNGECRYDQCQKGRECKYVGEQFEECNKKCIKKGEKCNGKCRNDKCESNSGKCLKVRANNSTKTCDGTCTKLPGFKHMQDDGSCFYVEEPTMPPTMPLVIHDVHI